MEAEMSIHEAGRRTLQGWNSLFDTESYSFEITDPSFPMSKSVREYGELPYDCPVYEKYAPIIDHLKIEAGNHALMPNDSSVIFRKEKIRCLPNKASHKISSMANLYYGRMQQLLLRPSDVPLQPEQIDERKIQLSIVMRVLATHFAIGEEMCKQMRGKEIDETAEQTCDKQYARIRDLHLFFECCQIPTLLPFMYDPDRLYRKLLEQEYLIPSRDHTVMYEKLATVFKWQKGHALAVGNALLETKQWRYLIRFFLKFAAVSPRLFANIGESRGEFVNHCLPLLRSSSSQSDIVRLLSSLPFSHFAQSPVVTSTYINALLECQKYNQLLKFLRSNPWGWHNNKDLVNSIEDACHCLAKMLNEQGKFSETCGLIDCCRWWSKRSLRYKDLNDLYDHAALHLAGEVSSGHDDNGQSSGGASQAGLSSPDGIGHL